MYFYENFYSLHTLSLAAVFLLLLSANLVEILLDPLIFYYFSKKLEKTVNNPVDPGRKLNVLCTFNLRPVSTGK